MIPAAIQALLPQHPGEENRIGHSGAQVVMYEDCVLKVQPDTENAANEGIMLRFLKGRLPVPEVLAEADTRLKSSRADKRVVLEETAAVLIVLSRGGGRPRAGGGLLR